MTPTSPSQVIKDHPLNIAFDWRQKLISPDQFFSLHQNISHCLNMFSTIIWIIVSLVSTWVALIRPSTSAKSNSRVARGAMVLAVTNDPDSCFGFTRIITNSIEPFLVTVELQGGLRTNQQLPRVTTQWGGAVLPISDQRVQGVRLLVDDNKLDLLTDLHTEADLGEGCVPVGGKFGLLWVKPSLPSVKVKGFFVAPERGTVFKSLLWEKQVLGRQINCTINYLCVQHYIRDAPSLYS